MAAPTAAAMMRADNRRLNSDLSKSRRIFRKAFRGIGRGIKRTLSGALSPLGVGIGITGLAVAGKQVIDFEDSLNRLVIQGAKASDTTNDLNMRTNSLRATLDSMSKATGASRDELLAGATAIVNMQGPVENLEEQLAVLAEANVATGASIEDLAGLAFVMKRAFGIVEAKDLEKGLSGIIEAGKRGSVPLGQMAVVLQKLSTQFKDFKASGTEGAADLASALQVLVGSGFANAEEAGTGLQSLLTSFAKKSKELGKLGVKVFEVKDGVKTFRSLRDILDDMASSGLVKDPAKLIKALGRAEAARAAQALFENRDLFEQISEAARGSDAVQTDAARRRESQAFRIQQAMNNVKLAIARAFTPERIEKVANALEFLAKGVQFLIDNLPTVLAAFAGFKISAALQSLIGAGGLGGLSGRGGRGGGGGGGRRGVGGIGAGALGPALIFRKTDTASELAQQASGKLAFERRALEAGGAGQTTAGRARLKELNLFRSPEERAAQELKLDLNVNVNQQGTLTVEETEESKSRRSTR